MRKISGIVLATLAVALFCSLALAGDEESTMGKGMMKGGMMQPGKMGGMGMMGKDKMMGMRQMMMGKALVATKDGGVIVMIGNKLQKYDKNLVLKKEVEIKIDREGMQRTMMQMMDEHPRHKKMMEEGQRAGAGMEKSKEQAASQGASGQ